MASNLILNDFECNGFWMYFDNFNGNTSDRFLKAECCRFQLWRNSWKTRLQWVHKLHSKWDGINNQVVVSVFLKFVFFLPLYTWGDDPFWLYNMFQLGWNRQLVIGFCWKPGNLFWIFVCFEGGVPFFLSKNSSTSTPLKIFPAGSCKSFPLKEKSSKPPIWVPC